MTLEKGLYEKWGNSLQVLYEKWGGNSLQVRYEKWGGGPIPLFGTKKILYR